MKNILYMILLILIFGTSCSNKKSQPDIEELYTIDKKFSKYAQDSGYVKAFIAYADQEAVLLRENSMPIVGKESISKLFTNAQPVGINFSWKPVGGNIAASGELGYTYGVYTIKVDTVIQKGTYVSIWKKDKKGNWKYILDSGNQGIGK